MKRIFEKLYWPVMITMGLFVFGSLIFLNNKNQNEKAKLYCIKYERIKYWAKEIQFNEDGSLSFVDVENKRPYIIYGRNYIIAQPKIK
jgi:predicted nucleic-acid-binding Zn-ribbon protein